MTQDERINKTIEIAASICGDIFLDATRVVSNVVSNVDAGYVGKLSVEIAKAIISEAEKESK